MYYTEKKDKVAAVFSYLGWIFWIIAFVIRNKDDELSRQHLNQGLALALISTVAGVLSRLHGLFSVFASVLGLGVFILAIMGIVNAVKEKNEPLPFIGDFRLL